VGDEKARSCRMQMSGVLGLVLKTINLVLPIKPVLARMMQIIHLPHPPFPHLQQPHDTHNTTQATPLLPCTAVGGWEAGRAL
jgi:hypothetical protein